MVAVASPARAAQSPATSRGAVPVTRVRPAGQRPEAPLITLLLAGDTLTVALRTRSTAPQPARQAVRIR